MASEHVKFEVSENQCDGLSLIIGDDDTGYRLCGAKVGGCETLEIFKVNVSELVREIDVYSGSNYSLMPLLVEAITELLSVYDNQEGRTFTTETKRKALENARMLVEKITGGE